MYRNVKKNLNVFEKQVKHKSWNHKKKLGIG